MAGHSQFANIKHRKGAQDKKRAKLFTKLQREISVAAKTGQPDPEFNPRLRNAIIEAKANNMPKDRIEGAVKKATSAGEGENYDEMRYEGYGVAGVAIIVEALTDNKNRTAGDVRSIFAKNGGSLGETNSVAFMFDHVGVIKFDAKVASEEEMFEAVIEAGAEEVESLEDIHVIITQTDNLAEVRDNLTAKYGDPLSAKLDWKAKNTVELEIDKATTILKMVDALEDCDDVQSVTGNYVISDEIIEQI